MWIKNNIKIEKPMQRFQKNRNLQNEQTQQGRGLQAIENVRI